MQNLFLVIVVSEDEKDALYYIEISSLRNIMAHY